MLIQRIASLVERNFLAVALGLSAAALFHPGLFTWISPYMSQFLGVIMFGMGLTLEFSDFLKVGRNWRLISFGIGAQYIIMPCLAVVLTTIFELPPEAVVGIVVVGACPSGTASNVISYLARANVALSVVLTLCTTLLSPILTPTIVYWILKQRVEIEFWSMVQSVFWIIIFPMVDGLVLRRFLRHRLEPVLGVMPAVSMVVISLVIACVVGLNQKTILAFPSLIILVTVIHNLLGFALGYGGAKALRCAKADAQAIAIEVGIQNSGLAVALCTKYFGPASALPGAIFSLWQNMSGATLAKYWASRKR